MTKKLLFSALIVIFFPLFSYAEKVPVKITPTQVISTHHDEAETGNYIKFQTVNEVYINDKLYINKETNVFGLVDFLHPNGWGGDSAQITIKTFYTKDINGKKITINYPLTITGNIDMANDWKQYIGYVLTYLFRGAEIYIEPNTRTFNIFIEQ